MKRNSIFCQKNNTIQIWKEPNSQFPVVNKIEENKYEIGESWKNKWIMTGITLHVAQHVNASMAGKVQEL